MIGEREITAADDRWEAAGFPDGLDNGEAYDFAELVVGRVMSEVDRECSLTREEEAVVCTAVRTACLGGLAVGVYAGRDECGRKERQT